MPFDPALYDDSKPLYAPLTGWSGNALYWRPSAAYKGHDHGMASTRLPGTKGDGRDAERAAEARRLTRELLKRVGATADAPVGTWGWLIHRYRTDQFSPIREVKENTRVGYLWSLQKWDAAIGHLPISAMTHNEIKRIEKAMLDKGRSRAYVHRLFTMLRAVVSYGKAQRIPAAAEVKEVLGELRFRKEASRSVIVTRDQINAIIAEADRRGMEDFACGLLLQWLFAFRAVDVRGQWVTDSGESGIVRETFYTHDGKRRRKITRWIDGLTWDMIAPDYSTLTKVISKTERSIAEPIRLDLTATPALQARLRSLAKRGRVGPVILSGDLPYTISGWNHAFARIRDDLGLPKEITARDIRAGALTEMKAMGIDATMVRDAAGHSNVSMTNRYMRDRSAGANTVVRLRGENKP